EAGGVRAGIDRDPNHFFGRGHFEIERLCNLRFEAGNVVVADVPPVFTEMRGDTVGACLNRDVARREGIWVAPAASLAEGGHMVDIDAEAKMWSRHFLAVRSCRPRSSCLRSRCKFCGGWRVQGALQAFPRSACATTSFARNCAMIELRCLMSNTSRSMVTDVKSGDERSMLILSMLPSCSAITWATWASEPGSFTVCSAMRAGKRCGVRSSTSQRRSSQRSGASSKSFSAGDWIGEMVMPSPGVRGATI